MTKRILPLPTLPRLHRICTAVPCLLIGLGLPLAGAEPARSSVGGAAAAAEQTEKEAMEAQARTFLKTYTEELAELEIRANLAEWQAANSGREEDFAAAATATLAVRKYHSDPAAYQRVRQLRAAASGLGEVERRSLELAELAYRRNQLPADLLERMVSLSKEIERLFGTFRAEVDGQRLSNNDLLERLGRETDSGRRQKLWEGLKQVGPVVAGKLVELAELRNQAAGQLGFANFWDMQIRLQEHDPAQLLAIFEELERLTRPAFAAMKTELDAELARRFGVPPAEMLPWHYDNPFFQAAPPSDEVDLDEFYAQLRKEDIVRIARDFYQQVGLPADDILGRSDLYEREGKDQHAFCTSINRAGDVRTLCNIKPTAEWMDTALHELGHAVYDVGIDRGLPYNVREPAHAFTTEGVAMLFGALAKTPAWMTRYAGVDQARVDQVAAAIREQRRREQLIFARWTLVMLHFEKALYENPRQDLNRLWWDDVERYQLLRRPPGRNQPDWASKPHFTIAPVYYHNYLLGELFAAQLRHRLARAGDPPVSSTELNLAQPRQVGDYLRQHVFAPGSTWAWPEFVRRATGEPLTAKYFAAEVTR